jgi:hypothetical protein
MQVTVHTLKLILAAMTNGQTLQAMLLWSIENILPWPDAICDVTRY